MNIHSSADLSITGQGARLIEGFLGLSTSQSKSIEYGLGCGRKGASRESQRSKTRSQWKKTMVNIGK